MKVVIILVILIICSVYLYRKYKKQGSLTESKETVQDKTVNLLRFLSKPVENFEEEAIPTVETSPEERRRILIEKINSSAKLTEAFEKIQPTLEYFKNIVNIDQCYRNPTTNTEKLYNVLQSFINIIKSISSIDFTNNDIIYRISSICMVLIYTESVLVGHEYIFRDISIPSEINDENREIVINSIGLKELMLFIIDLFPLSMMLNIRNIELSSNVAKFIDDTRQDFLKNAVATGILTLQQASALRGLDNITGCNWGMNTPACNTIRSAINSIMNGINREGIMNRPMRMDIYLFFRVIITVMFLEMARRQNEPACSFFG
jgi:hypothetical protein